MCQLFSSHASIYIHGLKISIFLLHFTSHSSTGTAVPIYRGLGIMSGRAGVDGKSTSELKIQEELDAFSLLPKGTYSSIWSFQEAQLLVGWSHQPDMFSKMNHAHSPSMTVVIDTYYTCSMILHIFKYIVVCIWLVQASCDSWLITIYAYQLIRSTIIPFVERHQLNCWVLISSDN